VQLNQIEESEHRAAGSAPAHRVASTDADGRYEFRSLPAGRYSISVRREPYLHVFSQGLPGTVTPFEIRAGETNDHLDFTLLRGGVITGRVVDEFGEPIAVDVNAIRARTVNGRPGPPWPMAGASTDDIGLIQTRRSPAASSAT